MPFVAKVNWKQELPNIVARLEKGEFGSQLAREYGVSSSRMGQILKRYKLNRVGPIVRKNVLAKRAEAYLEKWGNRNIASELYSAQRRKFLAKKANILRVGGVWELSFGEIEWPTHCPVLGVELDYFAPHRTENSVSFDQIVPGHGYTKENTKIISWRANRIKNDGNSEEHKKIAVYLDKFAKLGV